MPPLPFIRGFSDFVSALLSAGFSLGGGNGDGIFSVVSWAWDEAAPYDSPVRWHTGDPETDPWQWRTRVLDERDDIAYAKVFFRKSGYITKEWYPFFAAVRRGDRTFGDAYADGLVSREARRIYEAVAAGGEVPAHDLRREAGFAGEEASGFERALLELQMKMFITICGGRRKVSRKGEDYGWESMVFCTPESFFGEQTLALAAEIPENEAFGKIRGRILELNPGAEEKRIFRFIRG
ncbi:MAG: hypothetical protein FWC55_05860 [Firmicutes bacterium]|nr:hypothetical protein [Bacillota bacterium]